MCSDPDFPTGIKPMSSRHEWRVNLRDVTWRSRTNQLKPWTYHERPSEDLRYLRTERRITLHSGFQVTFNIVELETESNVKPLRKCTIKWSHGPCISTRPHHVAHMCKRKIRKKTHNNYTHTMKKKGNSYYNSLLHSWMQYWLLQLQIPDNIFTSHVVSRWQVKKSPRNADKITS